MHHCQHHQEDLLFFFAGRPQELALYQSLFGCLDQICPDGTAKVHKTQISFYCPRLFAAVSLPPHRWSGWPPHCLTLTLGLGRRLDSPRVAATTQPYPNRWTHHIPLASPEQLDEELMGWLAQACRFAREKRRRYSRGDAQR